MQSKWKIFQLPQLFRDYWLVIWATNLQRLVAIGLPCSFHFTWNPIPQNILNQSETRAEVTPSEFRWERLNKRKAQPFLLTLMILSECSPRQGSPLRSARFVTALGRAFNTASERRNAMARPSSSFNSAFSAKSDKASWHREPQINCLLTALSDISVSWGTYSEDSVMIL